MPNHEIEEQSFHRMYNTGESKILLGEVERTGIEFSSCRWRDSNQYGTEPINGKISCRHKVQKRIFAMALIKTKCTSDRGEFKMLQRHPVTGVKLKLGAIDGGKMLTANRLPRCVR